MPTICKYLYAQTAVGEATGLKRIKAYRNQLFARYIVLYIRYLYHKSSMVFSNPLSFSFAIPNVNEKHKHKIIVINRSYTIINICSISDILQKYNHFLAEMLGDSIFFRTFAPFLKTI